MKFSIIITAYNSEKFIGEAIDSALAQTMQSFEVVLVNDGSSDDTPVICERYAKNYPNKIIYISQDNKGPFLARRFGYQAAQGEYLVTLDGDDALRMDALETIDGVVSRYGVDVVLFGISRRRDFAGFWNEEPFNTSMLIAEDDRHQLYLKACTSDALNSMCTKAIKKDLLDFDCDCSDMKGFDYAEDLLQSLEVIDRASSFYYVAEPLYYYRVNYGSLTKRFDDTQLDKRNYTWKRHLSYAQKWDAECGTDDLQRNVYALGQRSYAEVAQIASEMLSCGKARKYMREITRASDYSIIFAHEGCADSLRRDFRLSIALLRANHFLLLYFMFKVKRLIRRIFGR